MRGKAEERSKRGTEAVEELPEKIGVRLMKGFEARLRGSVCEGKNRRQV